MKRRRRARRPRQRRWRSFGLAGEEAAGPGEEAGKGPDYRHRAGKGQLDYEVGQLYNKLGRDGEYREKLQEPEGARQWLVEIRDCMLRIESWVS
jgi:hypothetical protein